MELLKRAVTPFLASRLLVGFLLALPLFFSIQPIPTPADAGTIYHLQPIAPGSSFGDRLYTLLHSADSTWYLGIAENGYTPLPPEDRSDPVKDYTVGQKNWAFFPLFPLIERAGGVIFGSAFRAGLIASYLFLFGSLILLIRLAEISGLSPAAADRSLWLICFYPFSYFFSFPLTESLFLFLTLLSFFLIGSNRPIWAGLALAFASATRPTGLLLIPGFIVEMYFKKKRSAVDPDAPSWNSIALAASIAPLGTALYALYLWQHTGSPLAFSLNQQAWGRQAITFSGLITSLLSPFRAISGPWDFILLNTAAAYLSLFCAGWAIAKGRYGWALVILGPLCASLGTGITQSFGRFTSISFPVFLILAEVTRRNTVERIVLLIFAALLGALTIGRALYVTSVMC